MSDKLSRELSLQIARKLFPAVKAECDHTGSFLSPAIRYMARQKLEKLADVIQEIPVDKTFTVASPQ